jgi:5-hydroxyisourate hydrolase-like protein (transthyretin family)
MGKMTLAEPITRNGTRLPDPSYCDHDARHFGIDDPKQHDHFPFKCTSWGYFGFRGGA